MYSGVLRAQVRGEIVRRYSTARLAASISGACILGVLLVGGGFGRAFAGGQEKGAAVPQEKPAEAVKTPPAETPPAEKGGAKAAPERAAAPAEPSPPSERRGYLPPQSLRPAFPGEPPPEWYQRRVDRAYGYGPYYASPNYAGPWGYWWYLPQTYKYKDDYYPPPVALEPRLGLQYNYPFAWHMGLQIPPDSDPHAIPGLGPFVGMVGAAKAEARAASAKEKKGGVETSAGALPEVPGTTLDEEAEAKEREALRLMKEGKYREAGLLLAEAFQMTESPRYPLLLAEVFFALAKNDDAELVLRYALESKGGFEALPADVAGHFPSRQEFESKLKSLGSGESHSFLASYLLLHAEDPHKGFEILKKQLKEKPDDRVASLLYRRYLQRAF